MKDLVEIIKANPGCTAVIDNDHWTLRGPPPKPIDDMSDEEYDEWRDNGALAQAGDVKQLGDGGYGSGHCYGGDVLQALAVIAGINVESV